MKLTEEQVTAALVGSEYGEPNVFAIHNIETDARHNAAAAILLEAMVRGITEKAERLAEGYKSLCVDHDKTYHKDENGHYAHMLELVEKAKAMVGE